MLQAEKIHYRYHHDVPLLEELDCTIEPGEIVGLPGPSGCGKSTLGRLLAGYHTPQAGTISRGGNPLQTGGYCPVQMIFQHPEMSVNPRWRIRKILEEGNNDHAELVRSFGIHQNWLERYPHELSGGELQRIALIRAMTPATRYLIADEMTASLDPGTQALIWQNVMSWSKSRDVGILAISHDVNLLERICDRIDSTFTRVNAFAT
ncbi:ABC transporter ATP-binding protein [Desulfosediminicola flagellatus]|uniref:ABC transporter ATP-binding protein n=1 Tax=Desulfosediminicola flagellatus TaxID=2569541 RepID=UPI0010AD7E68|nr:ATP-binding cassette domain-containing protein [Desulfosediminicola flagellatus]